MRNSIFVAMCVLFGIGASCASAGSSQSVPVSCVVTHHGYQGPIISPGISSPTASITKFSCNGKTVAFASSSMKDGKVSTKLFGVVEVRFDSTIATVGAGDFTSVAPGHTARESTGAVYVDSSKAPDFWKFVGK